MLCVCGYQYIISYYKEVIGIVYHSFTYVLLSFSVALFEYGYIYAFYGQSRHVTTSASFTIPIFGHGAVLRHFRKIGQYLHIYLPLLGRSLEDVHKLSLVLLGQRRHDFPIIRCYHLAPSPLKVKPRLTCSLSEVKIYVYIYYHSFVGRL